MLTFPQLSTGALAQYPVSKRRSERTILNISADGRLTTLSDLNGRQIRWSLTFQNLTDMESANMVAFYESCEGCLQPFLFLDPTCNLFAYSEDFTQPVWTMNSFVTVAANVDDPFGTTRASQITNNSAAALNVTQTVGVPGTVQCTFSIYLRLRQGSSMVGFLLTKTDGSTIQTVVPNVTSSWSRFSLSSAFASSISDSCEFSVTLPAGAVLDVFGAQLDAQPAAGKYISTTSETGVFPNARFDSQALTVVSTSPGQGTISVSIVSESS